MLDEGVEFVGHRVVGELPIVREGEVRQTGQADEALTQSERAAAGDASARHCQIEQCRAGIPQGDAGKEVIHSESRAMAGSDEAGLAMPGSDELEQAVIRRGRLGVAGISSSYRHSSG